MNTHFNHTLAGEALEALAQIRGEEKLAGHQLATVIEDQENGLESLVEVIDVSSPSTKRMAYQTEDNSGSRDEIVWHLQGILVSADLPPYVSKGRSKEKARFLRQGLRLGGFGTPSFHKAIQNVSEVLGIFSRSVTEIQPPTFLDTDATGLCIDVCNRYFSTRRDGRGGDEVKLTSEIDPNGVLAKLAGETYYHGEENTVGYFERVSDKLTGRKHMHPVSPVKFKQGDIVEVQLTFMLVEVKGHEWKMVATLRCVTLLDGRFAQDLIRKNSTLVYAEGKGACHQPSLKRRSVLDRSEDEQDSTASKIGRMQIDEQED
ncbi:hypothetical protein DFP72DRAFT_1078231 [Ephemerocybe angulata]|uniref:Uncharacterized protein n=1 Tax=Ephemerocybe angulata TaxID=980116 RepID=A0A8H6HEG7_9AGAR|nr:hypothetical protein DFP72DRAFT_1078231 [Tulosesus angulatus]